mmetsp:Transcript_13857/g.44227  ORF Transcript_13857/g.44227 Transcript_13857/m.44227 type:complete len:214 (+) Transcript_13857:100-741(+)
MAPPSVTPRKLQRRPRGMLVMGVCLCAGAALARARTAWVTAAPASSRRAAAAGLAAGVLGAAAGAPQRVHAQEVVLGKVSEPGVNEEFNINKYKDPPEVIAKRWEARQKGKEREEALRTEFRDYFAKFAADDATLDTRLDMLKRMQGMIQQEKMLPIGITKDDVNKGTRAVKFNLGCVRTKVKEGDCKVLDKAINKLFATLDKTQDLTVVVAR